MIHICLITYKRLHQLVDETIGTFSDEDIKLSVVEGLRNEILEKEKRQMIERADVIIQELGICTKKQFTEIIPI